MIRAAGRGIETFAGKVNELEGLRAQAAELHRLRAQVTQLSREKTDLLGRVYSVETAKPIEVLAAVPVVEGIEESSDAQVRIAAMDSMKKFAFALHIYAGIRSLNAALRCT